MKSKNKKARRHNGDGGLREKPNGSWEIIPTIKKKSGGSVKGSICRKSREEALLLKAKIKALEPLDDDVIKFKIAGCQIILIREHDNFRRTGTANIDNNILVEEYVDYWLWEYRKKGMKERRIVDNTFATYEHRCTFIKKHLGKLKIKELTFSILEEALLKIHEETCDSTAKQVKQLVYNMMRFAKKVDRIIEYNPLEDEKINFKESKKRTEKKIIHRDDEDKVVEYCISHSLYDVLFALYTGARGSEIAGTTWDNINFDDMCVTIDKEYMSVRKFGYVDGEIKYLGRQHEITDLKSSSSYRTLGIPKEFMSLLYKHKLRQKKLAQTVGITFKETDFIFTNQSYVPNDVYYFNRHVKKVVKDLKIKNWDKISLHCLRHTYCSVGKKNNVDIADMQKLLGHSDISVTAGWYTHFDKEQLVRKSNDVNNNRLSAFKNVKVGKELENSI